MQWSSFWRRKTQGASVKLPPPRLIDEPGAPVMRLPLDRRIAEVVSVLHPNEPWLDGVKALERIGQCVTPGHHLGREDAAVFSKAHWQMLWPTFADLAEVRLIFLGTDRIDTQGFVWSPCIRMESNRYLLSETWIVDQLRRWDNILTQNDLLVIRIA